MLGLLALLYWLLATGRLITKASHERELGLSNKRGDEWKETALDYRTVNAEVRKQNGQLIKGNAAAEHFFRSVAPSVADTLSRAALGGADVVE